MKSNIKKSVTAFIIGIVLSMGAMSTFAYQNTKSIDGFYQQPVLGHYYGMWSECTDWGVGNGVGADTVMYEVNNLTVPTGYMGAQSWLYKDSTIYKYSSWTYNSIPDDLHVTFGNYVYTSGYYKAGGRVGAYNGTDYTTSDTFISPILYYQN